jgi:hypothetical protein
MTWQYNLERGDITDPDVPQEQCHFTYPETYAYYGGEVIAERGRLFVNAPAMLDLLKRYVADDPCAPADPRYAEVAALIERIERIDNPDEAALDMLHRISARLNEQFQMDWPREWAQANLEARSLIFNLCNKIFKEHRIGISREEVEGAAIIERKYQPVSNPKRFERCRWCGLEIPKSDGGICDNCIPF